MPYKAEASLASSKFQASQDCQMRFFFSEKKKTKGVGVRYGVLLSNCTCVLPLLRTWV